MPDYTIPPLFSSLPRHFSLFSLSCQLEQGFGAMLGTDVWEESHMLDNQSKFERALRDGSQSMSRSLSYPRVGHHTQDLCKMYQRRQDITVRVPKIHTPVIVQLAGTWDQDSFGNSIGLKYLTYAIAAIAGVPLVRIFATAEGQDRQQLKFLSILERRPFIPTTMAPLSNESEAVVLLRIRNAAANVCTCSPSLHTCGKPRVWEAFQTYWRPNLRYSLSKYITSPDSNLTSLQFPDLAVHIRCGDVLKYAHHDEYGYVGLSVYRQILKGMRRDFPIRIRVLMAPTDGPKARKNKDAPFHSLCTELGAGLVKMMSDALAPAEVTLDASSDITEAWAYLVFANATLCNPSTFCLWPTIAANNGFLGDSRLFFSRSFPSLENVRFLKDKPFLNMPMIIRNRYQAKEIVQWIASH